MNDDDCEHSDPAGPLGRYTAEQLAMLVEKALDHLGATLSGYGVACDTIERALTFAMTNYLVDMHGTVDATGVLIVGALAAIGRDAHPEDVLLRFDKTVDAVKADMRGRGLVP